jgi:hypothetical protein
MKICICIIRQLGGGRRRYAGSRQKISKHSCCREGDKIKVIQIVFFLLSSFDQKPLSLPPSKIFAYCTLSLNSPRNKFSVRIGGHANSTRAHNQTAICLLGFASHTDIIN